MWCDFRHSKPHETIMNPKNVSKSLACFCSVELLVVWFVTESGGQQEGGSGRSEGQQSELQCAAEESSGRRPTAGGEELAEEQR